MRYPIILFLSIVLVFPSIAYPAVIYVPDDYPKIQLAIDAASKGDTIIVRAGTYVENIDFLGKAVTLQSEKGPDVTIIDGNKTGSVVTFQSREGPASRLQGFTITNGEAHYGGGVNCLESSPTILENTVRDNGAYFGGAGIHCDYSSPSILYNMIMGNSSTDGGGGGIRCSYSDALIAGNFIADNALVDCGNYGGGIQCYKSDSMITGNVISGNTTPALGGGISCYHADPTIANNIISNNQVKYGGGGIHCYRSSPKISNNTLFNNRADDVGGGIICRYDCNLIIRNTILWGNTAFQGKEIYIGTSSYPSFVTIGHSDLEGGHASVHVDPNCAFTWGSGMIDADPQFVEVAGNDLHLTFQSPCRNGGDNSAVIGPEDFEGDPRIAHGIVDMGADEFHTHLYWTGDATPGGSVELKFVGLPGTSPVQLWLGSGVLDPPWATKYGDWYLQFPLLAQAGLGSIPSPGGVLVLPVLIPPGTPTPLPLPLQAGVGLELTNLSVLDVK